MLKNIVFDMGNVLIRFDPMRFIDRLGLENEADRSLLLSAIFRSADWPLLDSGELTEAELELRARERLPERLHEAAHRLIFEWDQPIAPISGMAEFVAECKRSGLGVYLLSNASLRQREYWQRVPGHEFFDGLVISAERRCVKPHGEIYRDLLQSFHLNAGECLFVDDVEENVAAAVRQGFCGFRFTGDVDALREAARACGAALEGEMRA